MRRCCTCSTPALVSTRRGEVPADGEGTWLITLPSLLPAAVASANSVLDYQGDCSLLKVSDRGLMDHAQDLAHEPLILQQVC